MGQDPLPAGGVSAAAGGHTAQDATAAGQMAGITGVAVR